MIIESGSRGAPSRGRTGRIRSVFMAADQEVPRAPGSPSLYRKVAEDIKAAIAAGGYAAGTRLPSESELAERSSVSRGTIRQAFAALRADGVIASRRGARRVVIGGPRVQSFGELLSFSRWARAMGEVPSGQVIALQRRPAKPLEAERWASAIDNVGGDLLGALLRTTRSGGGVAAVGLAGGSELYVSLMPFLLRGVNLLGVNSAATKREKRLAIWKRIASDLLPRHLETIVTRVVPLDELPEAFTGYKEGTIPVSYTHLTLPTKRIV